MKKVISLIIALCVSTCICACSNSTATELSEPVLKIGDEGYHGSSAEYAPDYDPLLQTYEDTFIKKLDDYIPYESITIGCNVDRFSVHVSIENSENISYFGNYIVAIKTVFESMFDNHHRSDIAINLENILTYIMPYNPDVNEPSEYYGFISDQRTGSQIITNLTAIKTLCELYPSTAFYLAESQIDPKDLAIYNEVTKTLEINHITPEDEIYKNLAPQYGMTVTELKQFMTDTLGQIHSAASEYFSKDVADETTFANESSEPVKREQVNGLDLYPSGSTSKYIPEAETTIPDILFETTAEENNLAGTVYLIIADIIEIKQIDGLEMVIAEYEGTQFAVVDFMSYSVGIDDEFLKSDPQADYSLPSTNSTVAMYLTYRGFSGTLQLPIFFLGANDYCVETIRTN